ncbi:MULTISPECIES: proline racemase family protein [unclassified Kribbella]|uniref:proline racemase family protein n=1 Tax=unclassified Kribbella TaxID=2644121 RepID=UPI00301976FB
MDPVSVVDYHTAGEPFRIVTSVEVPGASVPDRRVFAQSSPEVDAVRQLLVNEPRGHADMYGGFVVPGNDDGAHFGVLFWHKDGYSTACGHGTIALGTWAVESGLVPASPDGVTDVVIDVPSGRVVARVTCAGGVVSNVAFRNVPSYVAGRGLEVSTSRGDVVADVSFGGAFYASVAASSVGLSVTPACYADLIAVGREIKWALDSQAVHPVDPRLNGIYGTILYDDLGSSDSGPHQRNVAIFADGEVDRSPCGSGTSARLALLYDEGRLKDGQVLRHESIVGTSFLGRVVDVVDDGVITEVEGAAYRTGTATFTLDPRDPLGTGFTLR